MRYEGSFEDWFAVEGTYLNTGTPNAYAKAFYIDGSKDSPNLTIPESVTEIDSYKFANCKTIQGAIDERFDKNLNGSIDEPTEIFDVSNDANSSVLEAVGYIIPGQNIIKQPYVVNTGDNPAYVFMAVGIPVADSLDSVDATLRIPVKAFAMQDGYENKSSAAEVWTDFSAKTTDIFGETTDNSQKTELFNLYHIDSSSNYVAGVDGSRWSEVRTYQVSGYNYYVYAYNTKTISACFFRKTDSAHRLFFQYTAFLNYFICHIFCRYGIFQNRFNVFFGLYQIISCGRCVSYNHFSAPNSAKISSSEIQSLSVLTELSPL